MSWILAIDFGTTTTSAAMGGGQSAEVVEMDGAARMPSVVLATESGDLVVGAAAEAQLGFSPERAERTPKRRLGDETMLLGDRPVRPVDAVAAVLAAIAAEAIRRHGGEPPAELRLTHPARWGSLRRERLAEAAVVAGLPVPVFVPEPVAAAVQFADERVGERDFVAVYDLGGGTFDTAVLARTGDGFEVIGVPGGTEHLGGEAFDERLFHHVGERIAGSQPDAWEQLRFSTDRTWRKLGHDLRTEARRAKEALSSNTEYTIYVGAPVDTAILITRDELEALIRGDIQSTVDELVSTVERAGISIGDLAAVNLVGGSSRIPLVTRLVAERFGQLPQTWGDPKAAVALGAIKATRLTSLSSTSSAGRRTPSSTAAPIPTAVGGYEVIAELGRGGMGVVYLARQPSVGRLVAVKSLPVLDPNLTERLRREASVLAELQHPNIATVIDVASDERGTHVVMPFFPGGTAAHLLDHSGRLGTAGTVALLAPVAEALAATHDNGFLHRDVKPSNVLLSDAGDPYLADFGLALPMLDSSRMTNSRAVLGTIPYTAPELLADEAASAAADIYSLGVMGYQLLTGQLPFAGSNVMAVLDAVRRADPAPISTAAPGTNPTVAELVSSAFSSDPGERPTDLRAWAAELRAAERPEKVSPAPPPAWKLAAAGAGVAAAASLPGVAAAEPEITVVSDSSRPDEGGGTGTDPADSDGSSLPTSVEGPVPGSAGSEEAVLPPYDGTGADAELPEVGSELQPATRSGSTDNRKARRLVLAGSTAMILLVVLGALSALGLSGGETTTTSTTSSSSTSVSEPTTVNVPDLAGKPIAEAQSTLTELGLTSAVVEQENPATPGTVVGSDPAAGTAVAEGGTVTLTVAKAAAPTTAPSVTETTADGGGGSGGGGSGGGGGGGGGDSRPGGGAVTPPSGGTATTAVPPPPAPNTTAPTTAAPRVNNPPVPSHPASSPDSWNFCRAGAGLCRLGWYTVSMLETAFTDPDGDSWDFHSVYDADAQYGYVTFDSGANCPANNAKSRCIRYEPTAGSVNAACFQDWISFTATDPGGSRRESAKYWLRVWINC